MAERRRQLSWWERLVERVPASRPGAWCCVHITTHIDRWLMPVSQGRWSTALTWPALLLTTRGAKSGQPQTVPLLYFADGKRIVVIASKGGSPRHPAWYYNLRAHPEAQLFLNGRWATYTAHEATGDERVRLWYEAVDLYAGYETYQGRAVGRQIPVMVLTPKVQ